MANLLELASEIVSSHAKTSPMTKEELLGEISEVFTHLKKLEAGEIEEAAEEAPPAVSKRQAFGKKHVACMICGKKMTTLSRHLKTAHDMTAKEYRDKFDIPRTQSLAARDYIEVRRQMAIDKGLGEKLAKARQAKTKKPVAKKTSRAAAKKK